MSGPQSDGTFEFDMKEFNEAFFRKAIEQAPRAAENGLFEALSELKNDCDHVTPTTPLDEGNLAGDYTFILDGITQSKVVENVGGKGGDHHRSGAPASERRGAKDIICKLAFRMPYAAKWHEAVGKKINWTKPTSGPKYLEKKLMMFRQKYFGMVAEAIKEALGR